MSDIIEKDKGEKSSWFERNPKKTLMFSVLVFLGLIDWIAGAILIPQDYNVFRTPHPFYHHDLVQNQTATAKWGNIEYPMFTNSLGFRDSAVRTVSRETSRKRVLFIGDSFTEGLGVPYDDSFVGILDKQLNNLEIEIPITLDEAVNGSKIKIPTIDGDVMLTIPPGVNTGTKLRVRNKGMPMGDGRDRGDQIVIITVILPENVDQEFKDFIKNWSKNHSYNPRTN